jgi:hypothetical protein
MYFGVSVMTLENLMQRSASEPLKTDFIMKLAA